MLSKLFPRSHERYLSLPVLGSIVDDFEAYLEGEGYTWKTSTSLTNCLDSPSCNLIEGLSETADSKGSTTFSTAPIPTAIYRSDRNGEI